MPRRLLSALIAPAALACLVVSGTCQEAGQAGPPFDNLPAGWQVVQHFVVPENQTAQIGRDLGGKIQRLTNTILAVDGRRIQVNIIRCASEPDARGIHAKIAGMKGNPAFCLLAGDSVIEFVGDDAALARRVTDELHLAAPPKDATYRIAAKLVPVEAANYMALNELSNLLTSLATIDDAQARARARQLAERFQVGDRVTLRAHEDCTYSFTPEPIARSKTLGGDATVYTFGQLPDIAGLPYVTLTARVTTHATGVTPTTRKTDPSLLAPTQYWPVDDPKVQALAEQITAGCTDVGQKTDALLRWLKPGANIRFDGPVQGSRYGVVQVLDQGFGHCWDFADVFVTLARAAGMPARQVGGWLYGTSGHIWAEVLIEGTGWQQVDPTGGGELTCGTSYIPYFVTEDGHMPILYAQMPTIELVE